MAPYFPHFSDNEESAEIVDQRDETDPASLTQAAFWYMIVLISMMLTWLLMYFCLRIFTLSILHSSSYIDIS